MKYDVIVSAGCSYTMGANITNADGKYIGKGFTFTSILGERLNLPTVHLGKPGASNDRTLRKLYDWILTNDKYKAPLFLIGITGITRFEFWSHTHNDYFDIHLFDFHTDKNSELYKRQITDRLPKMLYPEADIQKLEHWVEVEQYMFNLPARRKELAAKITMIDSHIRMNNGIAVFFNSLFDDLVGVKERINFLSFPVSKDATKYYDNDYRERGPEVSDSWYHYLAQLHEEKYGHFESGSRSSTPPYGDYFCGGHPSPGGNIVMADLLEEKIKSL